MTPEREEIYRVFARGGRAQPLSEIGLVKASSPGLAYVYASHNYRERQWRDLVVAPAHAFYSGSATAEAADQ